MVFEKELELLCATFRKSRVRAMVATLNASVQEIIDKELLPLYGRFLTENLSAYRFLSKPEPATLYHTTDSFKLRYTYLLLPESAGLLFLGPYLPAAFTPRQILEIGERNKISPKMQKYLDEYYAGLPMVTEDSPLLILLHTFCERLWKNASFAVVDTNRERMMPASPISENISSPEADPVLMDMQSMEKRYQYENEMMQAVTLGHLHKGDLLLSRFSEQNFEKRVADPVRNAKNYCIIMNTLLRKAAENGGVHPLYLDRVSSSFAEQIERITSLSEVTTLMHEMFRSYCRLVRKHSIKDYSPLVQKAIIQIESDLSANLSLSSLAGDQGVSGGYLSTVFRRETGKTVTEYIREKRMKHATHLLATTRLQIQTVALHCGILDVQYFSKQFKKQTGMTPKEYRDSIS